MVKRFGFVNDTAMGEYCELPEEVQSEFGSSLNQIQHDETPFLPVKHLAEIGPGACELIINGSPAFRCMYIAKHEKAVIVLHSFTKTTNGVDRRAMATAKLRYKELMREIRAGSALSGLKP